MHDDVDEIRETRLLDAMLAAAIFATSPADTGGVILHCDAGPACSEWLKYVRALLPADAPIRRIPAHISDDRLLGGLDLSATLMVGRPVVQRGLLAEAHGGIVVVPNAERISPATASRLASALDLGEIAFERDGFSRRLPARFGIVALNECGAEEEQPPAVFSDRLALRVDLKLFAKSDFSVSYFSREDVAKARERWALVSLGDDAIAVICETASIFGVFAATAVIHAACVARIIAALDDRDCVSESDVVASVRLVIAPRATRLPEFAAEPPPEVEKDPSPPDADNQSSNESERQLLDVVLAAAKASLPPDLLALLASKQRDKSRRSAAGRTGALRKSPRRGRPAGVRSGTVNGGARLNIVETLRAAAPWQLLRRRDRPAGDDGSTPTTIAVRSDDFRVWRLKKRGETVMIFIVDASGSTAVHRLAEAKGAVELLLADCYSRRDYVALIAFSGRGAELLLPPTRSLARAKRNLADLPGGGGTPLASGIAAAALLCETIKRKGQTPGIVMLTDGRANIGLDGKAGRGTAEEDSLTTARQLRAMQIASLVIDSSTKPQAPAARIAEAMGATYIPLPHADAQTLSQAVRTQFTGRAP